MMLSSNIRIFISLLAIYVATGRCKKEIAREREAYILKCPNYDQNEIATFTWYRPYKEKISSIKDTRVHTNGKHLLFLPAATSDAGLYTCTKQTKSKTVSSNVSLSIYKSQDNCSGWPIYSFHTEVAPVKKIVCPDIELYENKSNFTWYKDCKQLPKERYGKNGTEIYVENPNVYHSGLYNCRFTYAYNDKMYTVNRFKNVSFRASTINLEASFATPGYRVIQVALHEPININCSVFVGYNYSDFPDVYWKINGTHVANFHASRFHENKWKYTTTSNQFYIDSTLQISKVEEQDFNSNFTCFSISRFKTKFSIVILKYPGKDFTWHVVVLFAIFCLMSGAMYLLYLHYQIDVVLLYRKIIAKHRSQDDGKKYDAYVIYSRHLQSRDEETEYFVNHILIDVLENKCGYKIYIPERNNIPGEDVVNCTVTNIEESRRLIIILTAETQATETWYEQQIGLQNSLINNNVKVIIITMGNVSEHKEMQESLRHIIKQKGTIKWEKSNINLSPNCKFWKLVRYHMP